MNTLEFSFEETPLEKWLGQCRPGTSVEAGNFLAVAEDAAEEELEEALARLEEIDNKTIWNPTSLPILY